MWNFGACGKIMRAADCKLFGRKIEDFSPGLFPILPNFGVVAHGGLLAIADDGGDEHRRAVGYPGIHRLGRHILQAQVLVGIAPGVYEGVEATAALTLRYSPRDRPLA